MAGAGYLAYLSFLCFKAAQGATVNKAVEENILVKQESSYKIRLKA